MARQACPTRTKAAVIALFAALVNGCSGEVPAAELSTAKIDTLRGGIIQVTNPGPSAWADTSGWYFVEERGITPEPGSPGELGEPDGVTMGDDGRVYVIQRKPHAIKVYGADGSFQRDIAREGEGPGEFRVGYIGVHGDTIALQDPALHRFTTFLSDGALLQSRPSLGDWVTSYLDIDRDGRAAVPGGLSADDGSHRAAMIRTGMTGVVTDTIILPENVQAGGIMWRAAWQADGRNWNMRMSAPLQPRTHYRYHASGMLIHGTTDRAELILSRTGTDTVRVVHTVVPVQPITESQGDSIFQAQLDGMEWQAEWLVEGSREDVPANWPPWTTLGVDRSGQIWLGVPGPGGAVSSAQLFTGEGVLLGTVAIPHPDLLGGTWGGDRVAVLDESAQGYPIVRIFRLVREMRRQ